MIIVGTHIDRLKGEDRERKKVEFSNIIRDKYLVSYSTTAWTCMYMYVHVCMYMYMSHLKTCIYSVWCLVSLVVSLPRPSPSY